MEIPPHILSSFYKGYFIAFQDSNGSIKTRKVVEIKPNSILVTDMREGAVFPTQAIDKQTIIPDIHDDDLVLIYNPEDAGQSHFLARVIEYKPMEEISVNLIGNDGSEIPYYFPFGNDPLSPIERILPIRAKPAYILSQLLSSQTQIEDVSDENRTVTINRYHLLVNSL